MPKKLKGLAQTRLARECARLDPDEERSLAEEGLMRADRLIRAERLKRSR
jgi:hypothetical protein